MSATSHAESPIRFARWTGPIMIGLAAIAMVTWSWQKWPDPLVDFGREIYVAWQLSAGRVLYVDVAYFTGPFSPYLNSVWFRLFGPSLMTLVVANLCVLAVFLWLFYALLLRIGSRFSATVASLVFVILFAFAQHTGLGNYNFVCPYSHELTHGLTLSLGAIAFLSRYERSGHTGMLVGTGFLLGLLSLTKTEILFSGTLSIAVGLAALLMLRRSTRSLRGCVCFAAAAAGPPFLAVALLSRAMPLASAVREALGYWTLAFSDAAMMKFFRLGMGINEPGVQGLRLLAWIGWYAAVFLPASLLSLTRQRAAETWMARGAPFLAVASILLVLSWRIPWLEAARPLPVLVAVLAVMSAMHLLRSRASEQCAASAFPTLLLAVFSFTLLLKMILNVKISNYGFALAAPATSLTVVILLDRIPLLLERRGGTGGIFRAVAMAVLIVAVLAHLRGMAGWFAVKTVTVGSGRDSFRADARGLLVNDALRVLGARMRPGATLAVVPEGALMNFLLRRANSTGYAFLSPFDVAIFGEERILDAYRSRPPDHVVFAQADYADYGFRFFGRDYGRRLSDWIKSHYRSIDVIGGPIVREDQQFLVVMERRE